MNYPQAQNGDIQGTDNDNHQTHKTYHFHNCEMVYLDSLNTRSVTMEDCGNHVRQVTRASFFSPSIFRPHVGWLDRRPRVIGHEQNNKVIMHSQSHPAFDGMLHHLLHCSNMLNIYFLL